MSWNKNTRPMSQLTVRLSALREKAIPYALVKGDGLNDMHGGPGVYVLSYAQSANGEVFFDQMQRSGDCDFDDVITTVQTKNLGFVVPDFTVDAQEYGIGKQRLTMKKLRPLESVFVVKNIAEPHRLAKFLHKSAESAQAEASRLSAKFKRGQFKVLELTAADLAPRVVNCVFQGI